MKKNKIICVVALVLVLCFTWVSSVIAADLVIIYDRDYVVEVIRNSSYSSDSLNSSYTVTYEDYWYMNFLGDLYNAPLTKVSSNFKWAKFYPLNLIYDISLPSGFFVFFQNFDDSYSVNDLSFSIDLYMMDDTIVSLVENQDFYVLNSNVSLFRSNSSITGRVFVFEFSDSLIYDIGIRLMKFTPIFPSSGSTVARYDGFLVREDGILYNASYAGSGITPEQYQAIIDGIEDIGTKMEDQNESLFTPEASDTDVIAEASSQKDKFDGVMSEYSSLNEALDRPDVNELLPDYSSVVGGYKDDEFYDVFDVFYGNGYIMFMLLASVFFATMSFVIFGKKA